MVKHLAMLTVIHSVKPKVFLQKGKLKAIRSVNLMVIRMGWLKEYPRTVMHLDCQKDFQMAKMMAKMMVLLMGSRWVNQRVIRKGYPMGIRLDLMMGFPPKVRPMGYRKGMSRVNPMDFQTVTLMESLKANPMGFPMGKLMAYLRWDLPMETHLDCCSGYHWDWHWGCLHLGMPMVIPKDWLMVNQTDLLTVFLLMGWHSGYLKASPMDCLMAMRTAMLMANHWVSPMVSRLGSLKVFLRWEMPTDFQMVKQTGFPTATHWVFLHLAMQKGYPMGILTANYLDFLMVSRLVIHLDSMMVKSMGSQTGFLMGYQMGMSTAMHWVIRLGMPTECLLTE